ncbi:MAG TPA: cytochrome b/b6 domain-containing protein, partial [Candidatus Methylacidiphilales bacterium]
MGARWLCLFALLGLAGLNAAAEEKFANADCLTCHLDPTTTRVVNGKTQVLVFPTDAFAHSVHAKLSCVDCHKGIKELVHDSPLPPPDCITCHAKEAGDFAASVHVTGHLAGSAGATNCWDCHGSHDILPATSPASPFYFSRQAETCGKCHAQEAADWKKSSHGKAVAAGDRAAPLCTDCHSEHKIEALKGDSALKVSEICSRCHASLPLNSQYSLPVDRVTTYLQSYHGLAAKYGSTVVANCASCHGYHKILPSSDPDSTISPNNLVATCGQCHPGANRMFVSGKIHEDLSATIEEQNFGGKVNAWVSRIYLALIFVVVGAMFIHNALLFFRKTMARYRANARTVLRMSLSQRWQHIVLAVCFIILAITGFALKFPDSWLATLLGSDESFRRWTHRIAGIVMLLGGAYHLIYLARTAEGRRLVMDLFPVKKDLADMWGAARYLLGWTPEKPKIGRFGYAEKLEYWAVVWGTLIMGVSGLMIWFKMDVTAFLPRWIVDVALTIHYYEAVLACLAIVVWHFYHVMFDPDVYPLNLDAWNGLVTEEWQKHEHPLEKLPPPA